MEKNIKMVEKRCYKIGSQWKIFEVIEEKNHLAWFIYEDITCRIALYFNLV